MGVSLEPEVDVSPVVGSNDEATGGGVSVGGSVVGTIGVSEVEGGDVGGGLVGLVGG